MAAYLTFANNTATFYQGVAGKELAYSNLIDKYGKDNPEILEIGLKGQHIQLIALVQRPLKFDLLKNSKQVFKMLRIATPSKICLLYRKK